ncbi:MAG: hypothetical protein IKQ25_06665 [Lachnospiraceae bacterium]|jgi:hypothetical protein|nr:hypothetical protein [Lachnospiraceae bacterium]
MRKVIALLSVIAVVFVMSFPVKAASESYMLIKPGLSFNGTNATCSLKVYGENNTDSIVASVTLKQGNSVIKQWSDLSASGYMNFSDTAYVSHGLTYTMQITVEINGISYSIADIVKTCN